MGSPYHAQYYGQLERQNREHRAWMTAAGVADEDLLEASARMKHALNAVWRRPTLGWLTAEEVWKQRPTLRIDRAQLRDQVAARMARLRRHDAFQDEPDDVVARFAIEQELVNRGFMSLRPGGNCQGISASRNAHQRLRVTGVSQGRESVPLGLQ